MLNIAKVGADTEYYLRSRRCDVETCWLGRGGAELNLFGSVDPDAFRALVTGHAPDGVRLLAFKRADRVPGWDLVFSSPKSVSLFWGLAGNPLRERLLSAHREAVAAALGFLEREGGRARRGKPGRAVLLPAHLIWACFTHPSSRAHDPQLHTHAVLVNVAHGLDGRWSSLESRFIYLHRRAARAIYLAEIRAGVSALGGEWRPLNQYGSSELAGIERATLRPFSKRTEAIEAMHEIMGRNDLVANAIASRITRPAKVDIELDELRSSWSERAARLGWSAARVVALLDGTDRNVPLDSRAEAREHDRLLGPHGLTATASAFRRDDVLVAWTLSRQAGARLEELEQLSEKTLASPAIVPLVVADALGRPITIGNARRSEGKWRLVRGSKVELATLARERRYSTSELLEKEAQLLVLAHLGKASGTAKVDSGSFEAALDNRPKLLPDQMQAVRAICCSGDAINLLVCPPGAGKAAALAAMRVIWLAAGCRVVGTALTSDGAAGLEQSTTIPSTELDQLLIEHQRPVSHPTSADPEGATVILVDDAHAIDSRRLAHLLEQSAGAAAKVVLVGNDRPFTAIEAGNAFVTLVGQLDASRLDGNDFAAPAADGTRLRDHARDTPQGLGEGRESDRVSEPAGDLAEASLLERRARDRTAAPARGDARGKGRPLRSRADGANVHTGADRGETLGPNR